MTAGIPATGPGPGDIVATASKTCSVEGCMRTGRITRGYCRMHHARWLKNGDPGPAWSHHHFDWREHSDAKPCTRCGESKPPESFNKNRSTIDGLNDWCRECENEYRRAWRKANPEKAREQDARHYANNREADNARSADYRSRNADKVRDRQKTRYQQHRTEIDAKNAAWKRQNPHVQWAADYRRRARRFGHTPRVERFTRSDVVSQYGDHCAYCDTGAFEELDHFMPVKRGGTHVLSNVRPSCGPCNRLKADREEGGP